MTNKKLYAFVILFVSCGNPNPLPNTKSGFSDQDSLSNPSSAMDKNTSKESKNVTDTEKRIKILRTSTTCDDLLFSLVDKSNYNVEVKKFKYSVSVDSLAGGVAVLKIAMLNTEQHEDRAIGWLKLDFNNQTLTDITFEDKPKELNFDTVVLSQIIKNCQIR
jgi:hypothetical protein